MRFTILLGCVLVLLGSNQVRAVDRPNIVWIVVEDMSPHFGVYGETTIKTPHVDQLAAEGVRFENAFVTCPVCSPSRSAMVTGMYQTSIGAQNHRSGRGTKTLGLPDGVSFVPELFRKAGYYVSNGTLQGRPGKTDYNFEVSHDLYDGADWSGRAAGQPFFAQIQLQGGKLRHREIWPEQAKAALGSLTDPSVVTLPPYYPRDPVILEDWARYLDAVRYTDLQVGQIIDRLRDEKLFDSTYVIFMTDHGISHARGKQFLYEEGIKIPFIVRGPGLETRSVTNELILHIDMAATSLGWAGIPIPEWMEARDLFADNHRPREFIIAARDRCDETVDRIRAVRTADFKYIRNGYPQRPYLQPNNYKDHKEILIRLRELHAAGSLNEAQSLQFAQQRPREELYNLLVDPFELNNIAREPDSIGEMFGLRNTLDRWVTSSSDRGQTPEPPKVYLDEMEAYLNRIRRRDPGRVAEVEANIQLMLNWAEQGR